MEVGSLNEKTKQKINNRKCSTLGEVFLVNREGIPTRSDMRKRLDCLDVNLNEHV